MPSKKKVLILFNGPHLAYSPTTLQLYDALAQAYAVTIIAQNPVDYNSQKSRIANVIYHQYYGVKSRKFYKLLFMLFSFFPGEVRLSKKQGLDFRDYFFKYRFIKKHLQTESYFRIISNDNLQLFFCSLLRLHSDFLSLELTVQEQLLPLIDKSLINCVLIQSQERYEYLFKTEKLKVFFVQNAPIYRPITIPTNRSRIVYAGAANDEFGFYQCLDFLAAYPSEQMTHQGAILKTDQNIVQFKYNQLLSNGQLISNSTYLSDEDMAAYLQTFAIGFCFYNFDNPVVQSRYFNYATAPSGKMFKYMAAGLPVVCNNIIGFQFVKEYNCGVLVDDLQPATIKKAVDKIRANYDTYCHNTLEVARFYSFDKRIEPYLKFIAEST